MPKIKINSLAAGEASKEEFEASLIGEDKYTFSDKENKYTLTILDDKLIYELDGEGKGKLVFEKDKVHTCDYETPYGALKMQLKTMLLSVRREEELKIVIHYMLNIDGQEDFHSKEIRIQA